MRTLESYRPDGTLDIATALSEYRGQFTVRLAAHLARRAGFGAPPDKLHTLSRMSARDAVTSFTTFPMDALTTNQPANLMDPRSAAPDGLRGATQEERKAVRKVLVNDLRVLQSWWLDRMLTTDAPLVEKTTLFWHGHFATIYGTKGIGPDAMLAQNALFRSKGLRDMHALTLAVSKDPAMMRFLDLARSQRAHPNENYARELMELFTLGRGNYTETDVRESARAFTGWTIRGGQFSENTFQHDPGTKKFLGAHGDFDGTDIVAIIFRQPAAAKFLSKKLLEFFVYSDPEPALIDAFAAVITKNDFYLLPSLDVLFRSNVFFSNRAYRALVKSPVEYVVGTYRCFGLAQTDRFALTALAKSGQELFRPPNVKGWDGGAAWLSSQTLLTRANFFYQLLRTPAVAQKSSIFGTIPIDSTSAARAVDAVIAQSDLSGQAVASLERYLAGSEDAAAGALSAENFPERARGALYLAATAPVYQLN